jgi:hypothetical protein
LNSRGCSFQPGVAEKTLRLSGYLRAGLRKIALSPFLKLTKQANEISNEIGTRAADGKRAIISQT